MNSSTQYRLKIAAVLLIVLLATALLYTSLHEGGHALAGLAFGGRITDFNVNFFNLGAHVGIDGNFTAPQSAAINAAGVSLPLLAWFVLMVALPKRDSFLLQWIRIVSTMGFLNTLLAWIVLPFLYLSNSAPPFDDVTQFIRHSGFPPLAVAFTALLAYAAGWVLFALRTGSLRTAFKSLGSQTASVPAWKGILAGAAAVGVIAGAAALVLNLSGIHDPAAPPADHKLAASIDLSEQDRQAVTVASFNLSEPGDVSIALRVEGLNTRWIDVSLNPAQGDPISLLHGEEFSTDMSTSQAQYRLPGGEQKIVLTCPKSAGTLKVYIRLP